MTEGGAPKILAFAGSTRQASYNKRLAKLAVAGIASAGGIASFVDLRDFPMPLYDADLEAREGLPGAARRLREVFLVHDGLVLATAEYNASVTGVLKNTIDWLSRPLPGRPSLEAFAGKVAGIMCASPGRLGGLRALFHVRQILNALNVLVIPDQIAIAGAADAFDEEGNLKDAAQQARVMEIGAKVAETARRLAS